MIGNAIPPLIAKTLAEHFSIQSRPSEIETSTTNIQTGYLLGYYLTKASSMSPALSHTNELLRQLQQDR